MGRVDALMPYRGCGCEDLKKYVEHIEYQRLLQFLMGLNETYSQSSYQILNMSPRPSINKAHSMIISEKSKRALAQPSQVSVVHDGTTLSSRKGANSFGTLAQLNNKGNIGQNHTYLGDAMTHTREITFFSNKGNTGSGYNFSGGNNYSGSNYRSRKNNLHYDYCNFKGHTRETCYKLNGYPPDFKPKKKCGFGTANFSQGKQIECSGSAMPAGMPSCGDINEIMIEWIVYSGVSSHMVNKYNLLTNAKAISDDIRGKVQLPTGSVAQIRHIGFAYLLKDLKVSNVMHIPDFKFNLLSVSNLTKEIKWVVMFFLDFFISQELFSGQVMGFGREEDGLYVFNSTPGGSVVSQVSAKVKDSIPRPIPTITDLLQSLGIVHQRSCVYTSQQNGFVERRHRYILETAKALKFQAAVSLRFWGWIETMKCEIAALEDNHKCGKVQCQACIQSYRQQEGLNYTETFSHVAKMVIKSILVIAATKHWHIFQMEVPSQWNKKFTDALLQFSVSQSHFDYSLFLRTVKSELVVVLVYVDDLLVTGSCLDLIIQTRNDLQLKFKMKDLGELKFFLGIAFSRSAKGTIMSQRKYALELIQKWDSIVQYQLA
ncbi:uncharacterized protein [Nicotiana sylvestris]|uniref:uncharacterized protein n=1 Tax=Nicotiana sylvestris TaxID=4096 RepID=UPI00388C71A8